MGMHPFCLFVATETKQRLQERSTPALQYMLATSAKCCTLSLPEVWLQERAKAVCQSCKHIKTCCSHFEVVVLQQLHEEVYELWQLLQQL
jgi:hypothetical protein